MVARRSEPRADSIREQDDPAREVRRVKDALVLELLECCVDSAIKRRASLVLVLCINLGDHALLVPRLHVEDPVVDARTRHQ